MALIDILRTGVRIADNVISKQGKVTSDVTYERYLSSTGHGVKSYASPVKIKMTVDWARKQVRTETGVLSVTRVVLIALDSKEVLAKTSGNGFSTEDRFTMADGTTGPVLDLSGFVDPGTGIPLATEVLLG